MPLAMCKVVHRLPDGPFDLWRCARVSKRHRCYGEVGQALISTVMPWPCQLTLDRQRIERQCQHQHRPGRLQQWTGVGVTRKMNEQLC